MIKTAYEKDEIMVMINKAPYLNVEVQEYATGESRNSYFDSNSDIYEQISKGDIDEVEFLVDRVSSVRYEYNYNYDSTLSDIFDVLNNIFLEDIEGYEEIQSEILEYNDISDNSKDSLNDLTLEQIKLFYPSIYESVIQILDELTDEDLDIYNSGSIVFDCKWIDEVVDNNTYEALAYWTVYFSPSYADADVANRIGLVPFNFNNDFYLALGGCGMDLSPKLDAYVALVYNRIPKDSRFFDDNDYFKYVVGETIYNEIKEKCKLEKNKYILSFSY